jgi:RNA polymerase sigma factor (sigma-70 family)
MATSQISGVIQHLHRTLLLRESAGLTDGQLLTDYISRRDEGALAALVYRHGPMVWGVCRRVLRNHHDAEDAFQATFLVFVRKAASIASRELVANWLYGVAHQTALKARATAARRKERERQVTEMPEPAVTEEALWRDLQPLLDEELSRLPDRYRAVIVLCDLEGKTRKEAAGQLGVPEGTVGGWLARARAMLAKRLAQRGVVLSGGALAAMLSQNVATAGVPASMVSSTIKAARLFVAGQAAATGVISAPVAALTESVLKGMLLNKLKLGMGMLLVGCAGVVVLAAHLASAAGPPAEKEAPAAKADPAKPNDPPPFRNKVVLFGAHRKVPRVGEPGESEVVKMSPDGTGVEKVALIKNGGRVSGRVSPDGRRLAYGFEDRLEKTWETWIVEADGSRRKLPIGGEVVAWSPDGRSLACRVFHDADRSFENWVIDFASGKKQALDLPKFDGVEDWSPKGDALAVMAANRDKVFKHPTKGIYPLRQIDLTAADASKAKRLTTDPMLDNLWSRFSPDGLMVAHYQRRHSDDRTKVFETIVVRKRDGSDPIEIIRNGRIDANLRPVETHEYPFYWCPFGAPCWSPDGKQVAVLVDNGKNVGGGVDDTRFAIVIATLDGKVVRGIDLKKSGFLYVGSIDWH